MVYTLAAGNPAIFVKYKKKTKRKPYANWHDLRWNTSRAATTPVEKKKNDDLPSWRLDRAPFAPPSTAPWWCACRPLTPTTAQGCRRSRAWMDCEKPCPSGLPGAEVLRRRSEARESQARSRTRSHDRGGPFSAKQATRHWFRLWTTKLLNLSILYIDTIH